MLKLSFVIVIENKGNAFYFGCSKVDELINKIHIF